MASFQQFILNIVLTSIPEEFFITVLILKFLKKNRFFSKEKLKKTIPRILFIVTIPMASISNILKIYIKDANICLLLCMILFSILISILCKVRIYDFKQYFKIIRYTTLAHVAFMLTEITTILIVIYIFKLTPEYFNQTAMLNFYITIPERIIQYGFLSYYFLKINGACQVNVTELIMENKPLKVFTVVCTLVDLGLLSFILKYFMLEDALQTLSVKHKMIITITFFSLAIFIFLMIWIVAILIYPQEKYKQKYGDDYELY